MEQAQTRESDGRPVRAGGAFIEISPPVSCTLYGYPGVPRLSIGVHDPLECNALWLESDGDATLLLANDILYVDRALVDRVRTRIHERLPIAKNAILVTATHTHSGPVVVEQVSAFHDPTVPKPDPGYLRLVEDAMVSAAANAYRQLQPAELGWVLVRADGIGTNRHDVNGPADLDVPVLVVRSKSTRQPIALSLVCTMHPTVLHEDSLLISGDFLGLARQQLRESIASNLPILVHAGACGNQSPRHVTRANTFAEASRIARCLSEPIRSRIDQVNWTTTPRVSVCSEEVTLEVRTIPDVETSAALLKTAEAAMAARLADGSPRAAVRTAECDLFGAQMTHSLARTHANGRLMSAIEQSRHAQVMVLRIGEKRLVAWPGEWFVEFQLELRAKHPDCFVITMANGELQGYVVTEEAMRERWYEAGNAVFDSQSSSARVMALTERLLGQVDTQ